MRIEEIRTGRTVDLPERMARAIVSVGKHRYATADVKISPRTGKPKRQYKRRDMRAED